MPLTSSLRIKSTCIPLHFPAFESQAYSQTISQSSMIFKKTGHKSANSHICKNTLKRTSFQKTKCHMKSHEIVQILASASVHHYLEVKFDPRE